VLFGRLRVLGLLIPLLAATAGCTATEAQPRSTRADVAVRSYAPPSGAPGFCSTLAGTTHLPDLPEALGTLTADPEDVESTLALTAAIGELTYVRNEVEDGPDVTDLVSSLDGLVSALRQARERPVTDAVRTAISTGLDDVGRQVQLLCGFPT
jgi:hypothetical protein